MMKIIRFLLSTWFIGIFLTLLIVGFSLFDLYPVQFLENKVYDGIAGFGQWDRQTPVALITIDEKSINEIGPWPWPRKHIADIVNRLSDYGATIIGVDILYPEKEFNEGLREIYRIRKGIEKNRGLLKSRSISNIYQSLKKAERKIDNDRNLASSIRSSRRVVLPLKFDYGANSEEKSSRVTRVLKKNSLGLNKIRKSKKKNILDIEYSMNQLKKDHVSAIKVSTPHKNFAKHARALGHTDYIVDDDGTVRSQQLLVEYKKRLFPSFALQIALKYRGYNLKNIRSIEERGILSGLKTGTFAIPTDRDYRMLISYAGRKNGIPSYSYTDVIRGEIPKEKFSKKIVLVGITQDGLEEQLKTPVHKSSTGLDITAHIIENILNGNHIIRPFWGSALEIGVILYLGLFLTFIIPRVKRGVGLLIQVIFVLTWCGIAVSVLLILGYWLKIVPAVLISVIGYIAILSRERFFGEEKSDAEIESIESNKMLGLSFQSQGMLDMAFDKFMKCPVTDTSVKGLLYNLGLDFERKRMFNKALAVYEHILKAGKYKDIKAKVKRLKAIGETVIFGAGVSGDDRTMILEQATTKPTLGRYEILEELGRGAMGTVYLGRDPKINREVAVKTLKYEKMDDEEVIKFKERFFKEAEAAGTLSHPNIVTIYDVGEEHDMAYIAMELLKGNDLSTSVNKGKLLPVKEVMRIMVSVAEGLDYAHQKGIVHRDVKPANIMLLKDGSVKITDFGIARIVDFSSAQTQTGAIFGTPNYMSPEQVTGKKVDGRSDLFSLGGVFYELLTAQKPFQADNIESLIHNITNIKYTPLQELKPAIPDCCVEIVDKLLQKGLKKRYKRGSDVVKDIMECLEELD